MKDPSDPKFQQINLENEAYQKRVGKINGGAVILRGFGFNEDGTKFVLGKYDQEVFTKGIELLKAEL